MNKLLPLKSRFIAICLLLTSIISISFAIIIFFTVQSIENALLGRFMETQTSWYINLNQQGKLIDFTFPEGLSFHQAGINHPIDLPITVDDLSPGFHELLTDNTDYHVFITEAENSRYMLVYDQTDFEALEVKLMVGLVGIVIIFIIAGGWTGVILSRIALKPVTTLANQVQTGDVLDTPSKLAPYYSDDVVGRLATAFDKQVEQIRYFLDQEKLFTGDVSHELRTPLTIIAGAADILSAQSMLPIKSANAVSRIQRATGEMIALVNAFLLLSKEKDSVNSDFEEVRINQIAAQCLLEIKGACEHRGVRVVLEEHAQLIVQAIPELIRVVIGNLVRNANRHTTQGHIIITIEAESIHISDTGSGIPSEIIDQVFSHSRRVKSNDQRGYGMGLAIVKRLCDSNGWGIQLDTNVGSGSHFIITFTEKVRLAYP